MMKKTLSYGLCLSLLAIGCSLAKPNSVSERSSDSPSSSGGKQSVTNHVTSSLQDQIEQISRDAKGRMGVAVEAIETGESVALISGDRKSETKTEEKGTTRTEFHYGKFQRVIPLGVKVQNTNVKAEYKDGILNLTLPKQEEEKNKVVKVNLEQLAA